MKKLFLLTTAITIALIASAQVQFGIKAGLNLATTSVSPKQSGDSYSMIANFHGGVLVSLPLFENFSLQPEAQFSGQGAKYKSSGYPDETLSLGYINIPVLFKYTSTSGIFAEIGPQIGFLISAKDKVSGGSSVDVKSSLKSTDFSGCLGIGYLSSINLGIDARYNLGFVNIIKDSGGSGSIKNGVIQIGVFYLFGVSKGKK
jgi:hypothetical protein